MELVNAPLRRLFDLILAPFSALPSWVGVTVVSLGVAVLVLLIYKRFSNQAGLEAAKQKVYAGIFEIRLFNDDFGAILRAQKDILRHNLTYLRHSLKPMAVMMPPLLLIIAQLQFHYGYEGLKPGEPTLLKVTLHEDWKARGLAADESGKPEVTLTTPSGIRVETPSVWAVEQHQLAWRVSATGPGSFDLAVNAGNETLTKTAVSSDEVTRRSPIRVAPSFLDQLLYPAEAPIASASAVRIIELGYPEADVSLFGWKTHWLIAFFILTMVFAFALKGFFGVTF